MLLETALRSAFVPGHNRRGDVPGANWCFLLPTLEVRRVVCVGTPAFRALSRLSALADEVVVCAPPRELGRLRERGEVAALANVRLIEASRSLQLPVKQGAADVVALDGRRATRLLRDSSLRDELQRMLGRAGVVYVEARQGIDREGPFGREPRRAWPHDGALRLSLTPFAGELETAVPESDRRTQAYFAERGLLRPWIGPAVAGTLWRTLGARARRSAPAIGGGPRPDARHSAVHARSYGVVVILARRAMSRLLDGLSQLEFAFGRRTGRLRRSALLAGLPDAPVDSGPPAYIVRIAAASGVDVAGMRWGLFAHAEYRSQKVLFFLFGDNEERPSYVVKLSRDAAFTPRLENAARALRSLHEMGMGTDGSLPRVAFAGRERGLAVVAERALDGAPFMSRTTGDVTCRYAASAIEWLTELGRRTAERRAVGGAELAHALGSLLLAFLDIYRPSQDEAEFLRQQIAAVASHKDRVPVVFQHGDPGVQNLLAIPGDRVAVLDWENAEPEGVPLWDLLHFLRSYAILASRRTGVHAPLAAAARHFFQESPFTSLLADSVAAYCRQVGVQTALVAPLFYSCWVYQALKEATRLTAAELRRAPYATFLRSAILHSDAPALGRVLQRSPGYA